jgi:NADH:ubiquinone oxidoreductase subunit 3 (subunit A)
MASTQDTIQTHGQKPLCPVCHRADQVKDAQGAYEAGIERLAPPKMPGKAVSMTGFIGIGMIVVGIGVFFIILLAAAGDSIPRPLQVVQVAITLVAIVVALVLSFMAFQRLGRSDAESTQRLPAWDRAMENWRRLYFCGRDSVVFDAQQGKVVSDQALRSLLEVETPPSAETVSASLPSHS